MAKMMTMARRVMSSAEIWPEEDLAGGWTEKEAAGEARGQDIFDALEESGWRRESMGKGRRTRFKKADNEIDRYEAILDLVCSVGSDSRDWLFRQREQTDG